jgi:hypothetical protein
MASAIVNRVDHADYAIETTKIRQISDKYQTERYSSDRNQTELRQNSDKIILMKTEGAGGTEQAGIAWLSGLVSGFICERFLASRAARLPHAHRASRPPTTQIRAPDSPPATAR